MDKNCKESHRCYIRRVIKVNSFSLLLNITILNIAFRVQSLSIVA